MKGLEKMNDMVLKFIHLAGFVCSNAVIEMLSIIPFGRPMVLD